jgi:hypothetical protein
VNLVDGGGYPAAFHARLPFSGADVPAGGAIQLQVELVWVVQAQVDRLVPVRDPAGGYFYVVEPDPRPLHLYTDPFALTGARVSKEAGMEAAVFATPQRGDEGDLASLFLGLEQSFLQTPPWKGENEPPDRLDEIVERFRNPASSVVTQTFFIETPVVSAYNTFAHADEAVASLTMTMTRELLETYFPAAETAFLLHAAEHRGGELDLADLGRQGDTLVANLGDAPVLAIRTLQLSQYRRDAGGWKVMDLRQVLESADERYGPLVADGTITQGQVQAAKLFWLAASQGLQAAVKLDAHDFQYPGDPDQLVFKALKAAAPAAGDKLPKLAFKVFGWGEMKGRETWGWWDTLRWAKDHWKVSALVVVAAVVILAVLIASKVLSDEMKFLAEVAKAANMAKETVSVYRMARWAKGPEGGWTQAEWGLHNTKMWANIIVTVIQVALVWYLFYTVTSQPGLTALQWWLALQVAIGATILAIIFFILNFVPYGKLVVFLIQLIFLIAEWLGFDLETAVERALGEQVLEVKLLAIVPEGGISFVNSGSSLTDPDAGFTPGNRLVITGTFWARIVPTKDGKDEDVQRSRVWGDASAVAPDGVTTGHQRGEAGCAWRSYARWVCTDAVDCGWEHYRRWVCTNSVQGSYTLAHPAVNQKLQFGLVANYSLAFRHCWRTIVAGVVSVNLYCETEQTKGSASGDPSDLYVDVLPASLDDLWTWNQVYNPDRDGDGVPDRQELDVPCDLPYHQSKTSSRCPDSDGDGLLDGYEIANRETLHLDPVAADADGDGLSDAQELRWNTDPGKADSDGDGLSDEKDLVHLARPAGGAPELQGGWQMDFAGLFPPAQAWPLPNISDPDSDGIPDNREWELRTNPRAFVPGLTVIVSPQPSPDTVLAAGSPMSITVTALNFSNDTIAPFVTICMGDLVTVDFLDLAQHLTTARNVHYRIYEREPQCPDGGVGRRLQIYSGVEPGEWATFVVQGNVVSPVATAVLTTTGIVEYTWQGEDRTVADRFVYRVDSDAPQSTILYPTEGAILTGGHVVVSGESRDPTGQVSMVELDVNHDEQWRLATGGESWAYTWELPPDGDYTLRVQATDTFPDIPGHREQPGPEVHVTVDQTPPQSTILSPSDGARLAVPVGPDGYRTIAVAGEARDDLSGAPRVSGVAQVRVSPVRPPQDAVLDNPGGRTTSWTTALRLPTGRPDGTFTLRATARDGVGNEESSPATVRITVDNTPPQVTLVAAPAAPVTGTTPVALSLRADELAPFGAPPQSRPLQGALDAVRDATVRLEPAPGGALGLSVWGDFNGDDMDDLAVADSESWQVYLLFGRPGGWLPEWNMATADTVVGPFAEEVTSLAAGDLNGDGYDELVVAGGDGVLVFAGHDRDWPAQLDPAAARVTLFADWLARASVVGDVSGDRIEDLLLAEGGAVYLALGDAGLNLQPVALTLPAPGASCCPEWQSLAGLGDVNGDGLGDFAVAAPDSGTVYLFHGRRQEAVREGIRPDSLIAQRVWRHYTTADGLGHNSVNDLLREPDGTIWAATESGVSRLRPGETHWTNFAIGGVRHLALDPSGRLWAGTAEGLWREEPDGTWRRVDYYEVSRVVWAMAAGPDGSIWLSSHSNSQDAGNLQLGRRLPDGTYVWYTPADGLAYPNATAIAVAPDGAVWVGSGYPSGPAALQRLDDNGTPEILWDDRWTTYWSAGDHSWGIRIEDIAFDLQGGVWVGTYDERWSQHQGGVAYLAPGAAEWQFYTTEDGLAGNRVQRIAVDPGLGVVWLAHYDAAGNVVTRRDPDRRWSQVPITDDSFSRVAALVAEPGLGLWAGSEFRLGAAHGVAHLTADPSLGTARSIAGMGDVDGDGLDDVLVGEPGYSNGAGRVLLFKGRQSWPSVLLTADADAAPAGSAGEGAGAAVGPAGDVNGDGLNDLLVAGEGGKAWLLHGRGGDWPSDLAAADATWSNGSHAPALSPRAGDANCDASPELFIPAGDGRGGLFFGPLGTSCAVADTGVVGVEVGLGQVDDPAQPVTATLPATWYPANGSGPDWQVEIAGGPDGLLRIYARGTDGVGNVAADPGTWAVARWRRLPDLPQPVGNGGRMAVVGDRVYVAAGNNGRGFFSFPIAGALDDPLAGAWQRLADTPVSVGLGSGLADAGDGGIYLLAGGDSFWRYDVAADAWTRLPDYPRNAGEATAIAGDGLGTLYVLNANGSRAFYRYTPERGWAQLADAPAPGRWGSALTVVRRPDEGVQVYALRGWDSSDFWRYDPAQDTWTVLPNLPGHVGSGGALAWACTERSECDGGDYIYAFRGQASPGFYRYHIPSGRWEPLPDAPEPVHEGGALAWAGGGLFALRGKRWDPAAGASYPTPEFWRWDGLLLVDRTPPEITWEPTEEVVTAPSLLLTAHVTDTLAGVEAVTFEVNGQEVPATYHPGAGVWLATAGADAGGTHEFAVRPRAVDRLGNVGYGEARTITLSMPELDAVLENVATGDVFTTMPAILTGSGIAKNGINQFGFLVYRNGQFLGQSSFSPQGFPTWLRWTGELYFNAGDGPYQLTARTVDRNLVLQESAPVEVVLDTQPPTLALASLADGAVITATGRITITGTASDAASGVAEVRFSADNGASWQPATLQGNTWSATWDVPALDGRTWHLVVEAADRAGLTAQERITVTVDNVLPAGLERVILNLPEGQHVQTGTTLEVTWSEPGPESSVARVLAALDQITNTVPTQEVAGTSFQGTLEEFGDYYFHLLTEDANGNRLLHHYGPWHAWRLGPPPWPQYTIIVDGWIDLAHNEWLPEYERLGQDSRPGTVQEVFLSWDYDQVFLGWRGANPGVDGELVWFFDTVAGGTRTALGWTLPFDADAYFIFRSDGTYGLYHWNGGWAEVANPEIVVAYGGDVEVMLPREAIGATGSVQMLAVARRPDGPAWAVLPDTNPLAGPWTDAFRWEKWECEGVTAAGAEQQITCPPPSAGQPDAGLTWLRLASSRPSEVPLAPNALITYAITAGNAADEAAEGARLTLVGQGVVLEAFAGDGTCSDCTPGATTWTVDLGTLPAGGEVSVQVTGRALDPGATQTPITMTVDLSATLPEAEPEDNTQSLMHLVDGAGLRVVLTDPGDEDAVRPGRVTVQGIVPPGQGASAARVEVTVTTAGDPSGADWQPAQGTRFWSGSVTVPEGVESVWVWARAWDVLGNVGPATGIQVPVDVTAPQANIERPATSPALAGGRALVVTGRAYDAFPTNGRLDAVEVQLDGGPWGVVDRLLRQADGTYTWTWRWSLPIDEEGVTHTLRVRAVDAAGNVGEPLPPIEVIVDTVAPRTSIAYPTDGTWLEPGTTQVVVWGWTEDGVGVDRVRVSLDGGLTWGDAVLAVEKMEDGRWKMEDGTVLEPPSAIRHQPSARLWAFAGTLPDPDGVPLVIARGTDVAGNVERPGPAVRLYRVVSRLWLPLVAKGE